MAIANQKLKLLYLMKIFLDESDEDNHLTMAMIISKLNTYNISAERKSIYSDIELLKVFGLDIIKEKNKTVGYYIGQRDFEIPELKLLVDAVQSSHFITEKKSIELINKILTLTNKYQRKQLNRFVHVRNRAKTFNESIFYNIDTIHTAINDKKQISFKYFDYNVDMEKVFRKKGDIYVHTPISLLWNSDNYYLITYNSKYEALVHYRVDRMSNINVSSLDAHIFDTANFSLAEYSKKVFGMYNGKVMYATLEFHNSLVNVIIDRFGKDISMIKNGENFIIKVEISDSPVFLSWMFQFGKKGKIIDPPELKNSMIKLIEENLSLY